MAGGALLLAGGASRRFGSDKRTHRLEGGDSLLHTTAAKYVESFEQVVVVLRPHEAALQRGLAERFSESPPRIVFAAHAHLGMGHSLAAGIVAALAWDYAFIALADMPFIEPATLVRLRSEMESATSTAIVQPTFQGSRGHPVGFGRAHFARLQTLTGDQGASSVLSDLAGQVFQMPVADPGILRDVDQPDDLNP